MQAAACRGPHAFAPLDRNLGDAHEMLASAHQHERVLVDEARPLAGIELKLPCLPDPARNHELVQLELSATYILYPDATHIFTQQARSIRGRFGARNVAENA